MRIFTVYRKKLEKSLKFSAIPRAVKGVISLYSGTPVSEVSTRRVLDVVG